MTIEVVTVAYGPPAALALHQAIADAKGGAPLAPVTVVVPSNHVGVAARRLLASGSLGPLTGQGTGAAAVGFLTVYRLAELLGASSLAARGRRPVSTPVLTAAARSVLRDDPGLFAPVAEHPATETSLVASYRELRDLPDAALGAIARRSPRAAEVVRVHRATRERLRGAWSDEEDLLAEATEQVAANPASATEIGALILHLPQLLGLHASRLMVELARHQPLRIIAGHTGDRRADADVATTLLRLGVDPDARRPRSDTSRYEGRSGDGSGSDRLTPTPSTEIISTSDADDEVREAVRAVVAATGRGTPLDRIAVLYPSAEPYGRLIHEHLVSGGVKVNGPSPIPLAERAASRALLGLLRLAGQRWSRQAVLDWMGTAPLLHDGRPVPTSNWEPVARDAGVVNGREQWDLRLAAEAARHDQLAQEAEDIGEVSARRRHARRSRDARQLRAFVLGLIDLVEEAEGTPNTWEAHSTWARRLLDRLLGPASTRESWPADDVERRAAERLELAIDRLALLGEVEGPVPLDVAVRTLSVELEADTSRVGSFGHGVLVAPLSMGIGLDLDLVVVVGLAEGLAPRPARDDSLLPDSERRAADGLLPLRRDNIPRQHRQFLAALASGHRQVVSFPRGDLRGSRDRVPSRWLLDIASRLAGRRLWGEDLPELDAPWFVHSHSYTHGLRSLATPATAQEHRLRTLLGAGVGTSLAASDALLSLDDPVLASGAEMLRNRASSALTRFDGNLRGLDIASPAQAGSGRVASATGLERWARCPFDYFVRAILGVREVESPEDELTITPMNRGSLVHRALERFFGEVLEQGTAVDPDTPWGPADHQRLQEIGAEECDRYESVGLTGRALFWGRDRARILADLRDTLYFDDQTRRTHRSQPLHVELGFGLGDDDVPPVAIPLPDGRSVHFRGQVDRIDITADGGLLVADYKTGGAKSYSGLSEQNPDQNGTHLQLAIYGAAARAALARADAAVRSEYWFVSNRGGFATTGYDLTATVEERISDTLDLIVTGIEAGSFPPHPTDGHGTPWNPCWSCDPDFLGVGELRRSWEVKSLDPAAGNYMRLLDPERHRDQPSDATDETPIADTEADGTTTATVTDIRSRRRGR